MVSEEPVASGPPAPIVGEEGPSKRSCLRRKRTWILIVLLAILVLFGIIFGAVYGVKRSESKHREQQNHDSLFAAQSKALETSATPTPTKGHNIPVSTIFNPEADGPEPTETAESPSHQDSDHDHDVNLDDNNEYGSGPLLSPYGQVPRDLGAAGGDGQVMIWDLRSEGVLWSSTEKGIWNQYHSRRFLVAPINVMTSENTQTAIAVDAFNGRIVYMHYHDGQWEDWQELEFAAKFLQRPSVFSRARGRIDVINTDDEGHVWIVSYDGSSWSEWTELGTEFSAEVTATSWDENRIDVFAMKGQTVFHKYWESEAGWAGEWEDLGEPFEDNDWNNFHSFTSSPMAVSWRDPGGDVGIDVVVQRDFTLHKLFREGSWSDWTTMYASHEGGEFPDTQSLTKGTGSAGAPVAHLLSRGTDDCIHYNAFNGTDWTYWNYVGCIDRTDKPIDIEYLSRYLPTHIFNIQGGNIGLLVRNTEGKVLLINTSEVEITTMDATVGGSVDDNRFWEDLGQPN